jgi:hypothetical protein
MVRVPTQRELAEGIRVPYQRVKTENQLII